MNCKLHGCQMVWQGDFQSGGLVCKKCEEADHNSQFAALQEEARDALLEDCGFYWYDGSFVAECEVCGRRFEFYSSPDEVYAALAAGVDVMRYCGGSPRCCP